MLSISSQLRLCTHKLTGLRLYSSKSSNNRGRGLDMQFIDEYSPNQPIPYPYSKSAFKVYYERFKRFVRATVGVAMVKYAIKGWSPRKFAVESQEMYIQMNEAFAEQNISKLKNLVSDGMFSKMNPELKKLRGLDFEWKNHGHIKRPQMVHIAQAKAQMPQGEVKIVQVTVKVQLKQSVGVFKNGKLIGGDPTKIESPVEYLVLERFFEEGNDWKIKGKLD